MGSVATIGSAQVESEDERIAFSELVEWRLVTARGTDARAWLHDLVTADVAGLPPGRARRSLLLTPTGRIRADLHVVGLRDGFLLITSPEQPETLDTLLAPYVLSSDVEVRDRSRELALFAVLGGVTAEDGAGGEVSSPSVLGIGDDVVVRAGDQATRLRELLTGRGRVEASAAMLELWRIRRATPRMGVDFARDALPAEAGLEHAIDFTKGCFLGQESVAKVRNLGHPPRVLVPVRSEGVLDRGAAVYADGSPVGEITSAATQAGSTIAIARVRWDAANRDLSSESGPLLLRQTR
jgi:folate-binding protein YgfZ